MWNHTHTIFSTIGIPGNRHHPYHLRDAILKFGTINKPLNECPARILSSSSKETRPSVPGMLVQ